MVCTDANACEVEAVIFDVPMGVQSMVYGKWSMVISPNPVGEKLYINGYPDSYRELNKAAATIAIYSMLGEIVLAVTPLSFGEGQGGEVDVSGLSIGIYYLELTSGSKVFRSKFVKQ